MKPVVEDNIKNKQFLEFWTEKKEMITLLGREYKIVKRDEWNFESDDGRFIVKNAIIDYDILYFKGQGQYLPDYTKHVIAISQKIIDQIGLKRDKYYLIFDTRGISKLPVASRKLISDFANNQQQYLHLTAHLGSRMSHFRLKSMMLLNPDRFENWEICSNENQLFKTVFQHKKQTPFEKANPQKQFSSSSTIFNKMWQEKKEIINYGGKSLKVVRSKDWILDYEDRLGGIVYSVFDHDILHAVSTGEIKKNDAIKISELFTSIIKKFEFEKSGFYYVAETLEFNKMSSETRKILNDSIKKHHDQMKLVALKAGKFVRFLFNVVAIFNPSVYKNWVLCSSKEEQIAVILNKKNKSDLRTSLKEADQEKTPQLEIPNNTQTHIALTKRLFQENQTMREFQNKQIEQLIKLISQITWNDDSTPIEGEISEDDPYFDLFNAIKMVEQDLADMKEEIQNNLDKYKTTYRELEDFAYIVSHDLKSPLRSISSLSEWIIEDYQDSLEKQMSEDLILIRENAVKMSNMIDGVLSYSRVGKRNQSLEMIDTNQVIEAITKSIESEYKIDIQVQNSMPPIFLNKTRLHQVFQNLIENAAKFMDKEHGKIEIGYRETGEYYEFFVKDNGPGIEGKHFKRIFQIFQTLNPQDKTENTGIGLTIVKKIVESAGGEINLESTPGIGSNFKFSLPKPPFSL